MDVELGSLSSFLDGWVVDNLMEAMDLGLEVFRDLPGCLSTMRFLILGGDFNVCLDERDGVGESGIDYSARALAEVVKDFPLVDAFRMLHPSDAGFT
ncbi:hypothetical protein AAFF_G00367100 [Aldrovandia affinis]|uniref:Uncharacterized protein n=1 Tax=Aldrovandia affinis TaxID=143900 RepID=A0AAD7WMS1_9TELE|nr:hypothetical protein AAFF_G00367100 [Aldrovandia affinis]